jgi:hypothetical protein
MVARRRAKRDAELGKDQLSLLRDCRRHPLPPRPPAPVQFGLFPASLCAQAIAETEQRLLAAEAWQRFKERLAERVLFGEVGRQADAMRRGNFAAARRL